MPRFVAVSLNVGKNRELREREEQVERKQVTLTLTQKAYADFSSLLAISDDVKHHGMLALTTLYGRATRPSASSAYPRDKNFNPCQSSSRLFRSW